MEKTRILFSPVGGHDPIASFHDGAVLHLCRVYRPQKAYLYLSQEMLQRSRLDDRYRLTMEKLRQQLGSAMEVELIEREELTQVQLFDTFYEEFEGILSGLHAQNPESEILLNLSSGTPAMKSALDVISVLAPWSMRAVQVATPNQRENPKDEDSQKYDVEAFWETDEDNAGAFTNRCREVASENLLARIKKESILRLMDAYNYNAALMLAQDIRDFIPPKTVNLLKAAVCRAQLDQSGYAKAMQGLPERFVPALPGDQGRIFEYVLSLQIKKEQGLYADYLRGLTPVVMDLFTACLKKQLGIAPVQFCRLSPQRVCFLDPDVMQQSETGCRILAAMKQKTNGRPLRPEACNSMHILWIFEGLSQDTELIEVLRQIREVESKVRNLAAHEIVSVTDDWIAANTGLRTEAIQKLLRRLIMKAGINIKPAYWDSYKEMNAAIAASMEGEPARA